MKGLHRATCVDNFDPESRGRIRIRTWQDISVPVENLPFAEYCSPFGGGDNINGAGIFFIPEIGSQVWILDESEDGGLPVYIGSSFYGLGGRQNIPIEAKPLSVEPSIRIIKSTRGHKLILDDRPEKETGDPVDDVKLENSQGTQLVLNEPSTGRGIRLGFGTAPGELKITAVGARLKSNSGAGLFINDQQKMVKLGNNTASTFIMLSDEKIIAQAPKGISLTTTNKFSVVADNGFSIDAAGGMFSVKAANHKYTTGADFSVTTGGNFNINSTQFNLTGQLGSSFWLDLPIPGIPGLNQGNIALTTTAGGILFRNGFPAPLLPPIQPTTFTNNDILMPTIAGRIGVGDAISGNAILEGRLGGIFVSGVPFPYPGTAGGLGGRLPIPGAPIVPMTPLPPLVPPLSPVGAPPFVPIPGPQPAVLGASLYYFLSSLTQSLNNFFLALTTNAPAIAISPVGPCVLSPIVLAQALANFTHLQTLLLTHLAPAPLPTNILSATVFVDG